MFSPKMILEGLGIVGFAAQNGPDGRWHLDREGPFDVLTGFNDDGSVAKRIHIYNCDYLVRKIEYFDGPGEPAVIMELDKYKEIAQGFSVPRLIRITRQDQTGTRDSVRITLGSVKTMRFTDKLRSRLFVRPEPHGFKHVYKVVGGQVIEQPQ